MIRYRLILTIALTFLGFGILATTPISISAQNMAMDTPSTIARQSITSKNAAQITELHRIGQGTVVPDAAAQAVWSFDGKKLAVGSTIGVWVYDTANFDKAPQLLEGHNTLPIYGIAFSPDERYLAATSGHDYLWGDDNAVRLWDLSTGALLVTMKGYQNTVQFVTFTADSKELFAADENKLNVWEVPTGKLKASSSIYILGMALSHDGSRLATVSNDGVYLWDSSLQIKGGFPINSPAVIKSIVFSLDDKDIITGPSGNDSDIRVWDIATGNQLPQFTEADPAIAALDISPDGHSLASTTYGKRVQLWNIANRKIIWDTDYNTYLYGIKFSPDGQHLALVKADSSVAILNALTGDQEALLTGFDFGSGIAIAPDGKSIAAPTRQGIYIFDTAAFHHISTISDAAVGIYNPLFSHRGTRLAGIAQEETNQAGPAYLMVVRLWDTTTGKLLADAKGHTDYVNQLAFTDDDKRLITTSYDGSVRLWDSSNGAKLAALPDLLTPTEHYALSPDGRFLAISSVRSKRIFISEIGTGRALPALPEIAESMVFSTDGGYLVSQTSEALDFWDIQTGKKVTAFHGYFGEDLAFSPDRKLMVSDGGFSDPTIYVFDAKTGQQLITLVGHVYNQVTSLGFTSDGTLIISSGDDGTIRIWGISGESH